MRKIETQLTISAIIKICLIKFSGILTAPFGHKGFYNLCKLFSFISTKEETLRIKLYKDCIFEIIFDDPYWNRLISNTFEYEPEVLFLLHYLNKIKFSFVDGGANWGFGVLLFLQENLEQLRLFLMNQCLKHFIGFREIAN